MLHEHLRCSRFAETGMAVLPQNSFIVLTRRK